MMSLRLTKSKHAKILIFSVSLKVLKHLWKIWGHFRQSLEVFGKSSEIFGRCWDVSGNSGHNKVNPRAFDSEKVGRYNIGT